MKALGMIEVYGYLAAVEALDSALKAANVKMVDVTLVQGGLVTVLITGEVGAVKAAIEASKTAAERVGKVISVHVIPRPSERIEMMLPVKPTVTPPSMKAPKALELQENITPPDKEKPQLEPVFENIVLQGEAQAVGSTKTEEPTLITEDLMKKMTVERLRSLARELGITSMAKKEIRSATKQELMNAISKFIEQER